MAGPLMQPANAQVIVLLRVWLLSASSLLVAMPGFVAQWILLAMSRVLRCGHLSIPLCHLITSCVLCHVDIPQSSTPGGMCFIKATKARAQSCQHITLAANCHHHHPAQPCALLALQTSPNQVPQAACAPSRPPRLVHTPCSCAKGLYGCGQRRGLRQPLKLQPHHPL